jgi:dTDP-4-dehydrorhamnose reductase
MTWLLTGASGQLGSVLLRRLVRDGEAALGVLSPSGREPYEGETVRCDLTDAGAVTALFERVRPTRVVHAAAISSVAEAHANPEHARRVNAGATSNVVAAAREVEARLVFVSTDMVFDGEHAPFAESSEPGPLSQYGRSKLAGELATGADPRALVVRLPLLYGIPAAPRETTFSSQVSALREGRPLTLFHDEIRTPLWLEDAATALVTCARSTRTGVLHAGGPERLSRLDMGRLLAAALGVRAPDLRAVSRTSVPAPEPRARDLSLDSSAYRELFGAWPGRPMADALAAIWP